MKALLIVFFLPTAETRSDTQPQFSAVHVDTVESCQFYAEAVSELHAETEDPRALKVVCVPAAG